MPKLKGLSAKEEGAVEYYCNPGSETHNNWCGSYKKANYSQCTGWERNAIKVLHKDHIQTAIAGYKAVIVEQLDVTCDEIISALRQLSGLDAGGVVLSNTDKLRALELLGRYKAMFTDKLQQTGDGLQLNFTTTEPKSEAEPGPKLVKDAG